MSDSDENPSRNNEESEADSEQESDQSVTEEERTNIRQKLAAMSFEELQQLKSTMGAKLINKTLFGTETKNAKASSFKRANKNRPREMSSKKRIRIQNTANPVKKRVISKDPRFDPLMGDFDKKSFKSSYKFLDEMRINERKELTKELNKTDDAEKKKKLKSVIQRLDNQIRENERTERAENQRFEEKKQIKEQLKAGEKPKFKKRSVMKLEKLINRYEELKKTNKLQKHIEKKSKKLVAKDRKRARQYKIPIE